MIVRDTYDNLYSRELALALEQQACEHEQKVRRGQQATPRLKAPSRGLNRKLLVTGAAVLGLLIVSQDPTGISLAVISLIFLAAGIFHRLR